MKNIMLIILVGCFSCKAQQVLPLETKGAHIEGAYYKDLNNELDPYVGTWKGVFDNKNFTITFSKVKINDSFLVNYSKDRILGRYKMQDSNGNVLYSTYNLSDANAKVTSLGFVENTSHTKLRLFFGDLCITGQIVLNFENAQKTQMHWTYYTEQTLVTDDSGCAPYNEMPRGKFILYKQ